MNIKASSGRTWVYMPVLLAISVLLSCCANSDSMLAGGGTGGTGISTGVITGFGSVYVNGVEYSTGAGTIRKRLDDNTANITGSDNEVFRVGMVVTLRYGLSGNNAVEIVYQSNVEGPISGMNTADNTFVILGQTVHVDAGTRLYDDTGNSLASFADLQINNVVEVSGLADNKDILHATFLERKSLAPDPDEEFEIKGYVSGLDNVARTFLIGPTPGAGSIQVSYDDSTSFEDLPGGLGDGLYVEVETDFPYGLPIVATAIEGKSDTAGESMEGDVLTIEGYPASIDPVGMKFYLNGVRVAAATAGYSPPGKGFSDIGAATKVRAKGTMAGGELVASQIEFD